MIRILHLGMEAAAAGVFLLPVLLVLNKFRFQNQKRTSYYLLFTLYLSAVWAAVGLPNVTYVRFDINLNIIPFAGMIRDLKNSLLNVFLFVPLGIFLPLLWQRYQSAKKTVLVGLSLSLYIELLQLFTFRATDVNDLITNVLGTFLGWVIGRFLFSRHPIIIPNEDRKALPLLIGCVFSIMFFLQPVLFNFLYYSLT